MKDEIDLKVFNRGQYREFSLPKWFNPPDDIKKTLKETLQDARAYLLDILDDALTGDAISGSAAAKRDIFNWLITTVIPSAYYLRIPSTLY